MDLNLMPLRRSALSYVFRKLYGAHFLDHLAADGAGFPGGQVAVVAFLQVHANLL